MGMNLTGEALRVLGCLVEKERTTPEYYPLSINALTNACNQKSNRDPVMALSEAEVQQTVDGLRGSGWAVRSADSGRVAKYGHNLAGKFQLSLGEAAVIAELLLRGPQTSGELRARAERMHHFVDIVEVEAALLHLAEREPPLVAKLGRQPGHKESRFGQLLGGDPIASVHAPVASSEATADRVARLEEEVGELRLEIARLWREMRSLTLAPEEPT